MEILKRHYKKIILVCILVVATYLRLYRIGDFMLFLGDEGRDMLVISRMLGGDITFLGPRSSAADFFYGPAYYYMITPFLLLSGFDPVGPSIFVALLGVATVYLVYYVAREFYGWVGASIASGLYALAPLAVIFSKSSWNPNPLPFFSLLALYITYKGVEKPSWKKFLCIGFLLGISLQLHYLSLFLIACLSLFLFVATVMKERTVPFLRLIKSYVLIVLGALLALVPFIGFEVKNGFPNTTTLFGFIFGSVSGNQEVETSASFVEIVVTAFLHFFLRVLSYFPNDVSYFADWWHFTWYTLTLGIAVASIIALFYMRNKTQVVLFLLWLLSILFFGFYKKELYDYHFEYAFTLPFLLIGNLCSLLLQNKKYKGLGIVATVVIVGFVAGISIFKTPIQHPPNRQKDQAKTIAEFVLAKADNKPFNFALLTPGNSDHAYRYYFEINDKPPVEIQNFDNDPKRTTVTDQLLIVCEDPNCEPLGNSLWEIAGFGRAEIEGVWDVSVVKVYRLTHYKDRN